MFLSQTAPLGTKITRIGQPCCFLKSQSSVFSEKVPASTLKVGSTAQRPKIPRCQGAGGLISMSAASAATSNHLACEESQTALYDLLSRYSSSISSPSQIPSLDTLQSISSAPLTDLCAVAARIRDLREDADVITFSPKVFIPLTRLCRDTCGYCTFAQGPQPGVRAFMTPEEVLTVAHRGREAGCTEALFTLGDKPELRWKQARDEVRPQRGGKKMRMMIHETLSVHFTCYYSANATLLPCSVILLWACDV